jgi:hypothetical protein
MESRRHFLRCAAASMGLAWAGPVLAAPVRARPKRLDPLLTPAAQKAIKAGLNYLKDGQHKDGSFGTRAYKGNVGITSLAGLALLSAGHRPGVGPFGPALDTVLDFVLGHEDARWPGFLNNARASPHGPMYNHGFAVQFLAVARGHVRDKKRAANLRPLLDRAVQRTIASQNAEKGWRYTPTSRDSDLTVTAGQLCALRAARDAGLAVPQAALADGAGFVKKCQDVTGGFRYTLRGGAASWPRTAAALLALYNAGVTRGLEVERGLAYLLKNRPAGKAVRRDMHYFFGHYYAALATWAAGGDARKQWYPAARDELVAGQGGDGGWADLICPHYGTAMALLALLAPHGLLSPKF